MRVLRFGYQQTINWQQPSTIYHLPPTDVLFVGLGVGGEGDEVRRAKGTGRVGFTWERENDRAGFHLGFLFIHMTLVVWYDIAMRKMVFLALMLSAAVFVSAVFLASSVSYAQSGGGIGSGGSGSGGGSSAGHFTYYGWGWRIYPVTSSGPSAGFRNGASWSSVRSTCNGYTSSVAVFVIDNAAHQQRGYDYKSVYYGPPTFRAYKSSSPYVPVSTAQSAFNSLPSSIRSGFSFGTNVSWFCYGVIAPPPPPPVNNTAKLEGAKIDDSKAGIYGGGTPAALNPVAVSVTNSGSVTANPFFFDGGSGHGSSISMGTATSISRTIAINSIPPGWQLVGHSICDAANATCTSAWLADNTTAAGVMSFTHTFSRDHTYRLRWVFRKIVATCSIHTFPAQMLVNTVNSFTVSLDISHWSSSLFTAGSNPALAVQVRGPLPTATLLVDDPGVNYTVAGTNPGTITSAPISFAALQPGRYEMQWKLTGAGLDTALCPNGNNGSWSNPAVGYAGYRPFFDVTGGDILSGGDIRSWNGDNAGTLGYAGAGTQLAALAAGSIQNFITGSGLPGGTAAESGHGLAFANTTSGGTTYGGGYAFTGFVPNNPTQTGTLSGAVNLGSLTDGVYYATSSISLYGQLPTGVQVTIVASSGDATITGNVTYGAYGSSTADIPRLTLLVSNGNIYVDRGVTELHGVYYAGGSGGSGNFYSCTNGSTPINLATSATGYNDCRNRLTVYGAVAANKLILSRTWGSLVAAGSALAEPAENFFYSPELWLAPDGSNSGNSTVKYDSYVSLPPVL